MDGNREMLNGLVFRNDFDQEPEHVAMDSVDPTAILNLGLGLQDLSQLEIDESLFDYLDKIQQGDICTSPLSPLEHFYNSEAMETDHISQPPTEIPPVAVVAPVAALAGADPAGMGTYHEMETMEGSMDRISSMEVHQALTENPRLFEERFGSLELQPSRDNSGQFPNGQTGQQLGDSGGCQQVPIQPLQPSQSVQAGTDGASPEIVTTTAVTEPQGSTSEWGHWDLPEDHVFKVVVSLMATRVLDETIDSKMGCLLCYQSPDQAVVPRSIAGNPRRLQVTTMVTKKKEDGSTCRSEIGWIRDNHKKYTERILESMTNGVSLYSREGSIYAKRQCRSKIFWTSTQQPMSKQAVELPRDAETKIFDMGAFLTEFRSAVENGQFHDMVLPCVRFSFAQKWNIESETFHTKLVTARIEPCRAAEMLRWLNPNIEPVSHTDSHHTGNILISDH